MSGARTAVARRRGGRRPTIVVAVLTVLVLVVAAIGVGWTLGRTVWTPDRPVTAFLQALERGEVQRALDIGGVRTTSADVLLTAQGYAAGSDHVTGHRLLGTTVEGDTAVVRESLEQRDGSSTATFTLRRAGFALGSFGTWRLVPIALGQVRVDVRGPAGAGVDVAGIRLPTTGQLTSFRALPGRYDVAMGSTADWTGGRASSVVRGFGADAVTGAQLSARLTAAGTAAATRAVDAWVDGCVASTALHPAGCSFSVFVQDDEDAYSNQRWTLDRRPSFSVGDWTGAGWLVTTTARGAVTFRATYTSPTGRGTGTAGPIQFSADGLITAFGDDGATFAPLTGGIGRNGTTTI